MALLKLDKLGSRERIGLALALVFVLVLLVDRLVVGVVSEKVGAVEAQAAADARQLQYNRSVLRSKGPVEAEYARIEDRLATPLSDSEAIDEIKGEVDDLARASGVELLSMEHRPPSVAMGYTEYLIEIRKFEASMDNLLRFLSAVWQSPGMMRVEKVTIAPGGEGGSLTGTMLISKILIPAGTPSSPHGDSGDGGAQGE